MFGVTVLALMTALATSPEPPGDFLPGEIMVRFVSGSEPHKLVSRVAQQSTLRLEELDPVVKQLESRTDIPLAVTQLTGGGWVVLKVDVGRLNQRLVDRLRRHRNVATAELAEEGPSFIGFTLPKKVTVQFEPGSDEAKTVSEKLKNQGENEFTNLVSQLEKTTESPLICEATRKEELLAQIDLKALTLALQERLNALHFVDTVQLNYVMKPF